MSYMPDNETRCIAIRCFKANACTRHKCAPGGKHPVADLSMDMVAGACPHYEPLGRWVPPLKAKPAPRVHECPEGLKR